MRAVSEVVLPLEKGPGMPVPEIAIGDPLSDGRAKLSIVLTIGGKTTTVRPTFVENLELNAARCVRLYRCRVGKSGFVFEAIVGSYLGSQHHEIAVSLFFSDPTTKAMSAKLDSATIATEGLWLALRHREPFAMRTTFHAPGSQTQILRDITIGDGQGIRRLGILAPAPDGKHPVRDQSTQAAVAAPLFGATTWRGTNAFGPFGFVPDAPPWLRGALGRVALAKRHSKFAQQAKTPGHPLQRLPLMLQKGPGATGDQMDFGIIKVTPVASTGLPSFLHEVEFSALQEACRPVHFFESNGAPIQTRDHPQWITWNCRTHWNCRVSPDRLGKPCPEPKFERHKWDGKDRQHWSTNYLCGYYLMTGSHWARREIENEVQLFLSIQTIRNVPTSSTGAARAVGRMLLAGCWLHQCTGDKTLLKRIEHRLKLVYLKTWKARGLGPECVRPIFIQRPESHVLGGEVRYWIPWEECIAAIGMEAAYRLTGSPAAKELAAALSINVLRHGWVIRRNDARIGYRLAFQPEGKPIPDEILASEPKTLSRLGGGGLAMWSIGAVEIALHYATKESDEFMVAKAQNLLRLLRRGRNKPPRDGWWDKYRDWDAVRMRRP